MALTMSRVPCPPLPAVDPVALREALHRAADAHRARAQDMRAGNGIERHLFALMCAARELGVKPPPLFKAAGLRRMLTNTLSTSTLASDVINVGGFGPVEAVGYVAACSTTTAARVLVQFALPESHPRPGFALALAPDSAAATSCSQTTSTWPSPPIGSG